MAGFSSLLGVIAVEIDLRLSRVGRPILELWSLIKARGGVYILSREGAAALWLACAGGLPGGRKPRFVGLGQRPLEGVEGVLGREFRAEAGLAGGPIEPPLFTVLERRRVGDGAGEI